MRFIEEEDELWLLGIAHFRQAFKQFRKQPEQKGRVELRRLQQPVRRQQIHDAMAVAVRLQKIVDVEGRLAEEIRATFILKRNQAALDGANARRRDVAVFRLKLLALLTDILKHRLQIFEVEQKKAVVVRNLEHE